MKKYHVFSEKILHFSKMLGCYEETSVSPLMESFMKVRNKLLYTSATATVNKCSIIDEEGLYEYITQCNELYDVICWINRNILIQLDTLESKTLRVRFRIASGMLNKAINNNNIDPKIGVVIHDNFVNNLKELYFDLNSDELPF